MFSKARSLKVIAIVAILMLFSLTVVVVSAAPLWWTQISTTASAHASGVKVGFPVTDAITLTVPNDGGKLNGVLTSYYCAASSCASGGTLFWTSAPFTKTVDSTHTVFTFVSGPFTPTVAGTYSFRSVYTHGPLIPPQNDPYPSVSDPGTGNEVFTVVPAYSIGNRVMWDTNNDTLPASPPVGIANVKMELLKYPSASCVGTPTTTGPISTNANGYYRFDFSNTGWYKVQVAASNFSAGGALVGYYNSTGVNTVDVSDHGVDTPVSGAIQSGCVTITAGGEPTGESDLGPGDSTAAADNNSDLKQDFTFYRIVLGNKVWNDNPNKNGLFDSATESGFSAVTVNLLSVSAGACTNTILQTTTTNSTGIYGFNVAQGTYCVQVAVPTNYTPATPSSSTPNNNTDNDSNGVDQSGAFINSKPITLVPGVASGGQTIDNSTGTTNNPTMDFGFKSSGSTAVTLSSFNASNGSPSASLYLGFAIMGALTMVGAGLFLARKQTIQP